MKKKAAKTIYVALLRGINVGGKNKVDMKLLKKTFERAGMQSVVTYINSGNVVFFDPEHAKEEISPILEKAIQKDFKLKLKVVVRDLSQYKKVVKALPEAWQNDDSQKSDVLFLWDEIDRPGIVKELRGKPEIDTVRYVSGAILWNVDRKNVTRSGLMKLVGTDLYKKMTVRNVNTTRKIYELMCGVQNE